MATPRILVTGGTGTLGRLVVPLLLEAGRDVRVLSRRGRPATDGVQSAGGAASADSAESANDVEFVTGDLGTGDGIQAAVDGTEIVVHCAGSTKGDEDKARHLVRAAARAGTAHLVNISVVGADRVPVVSGIDRAMFGYFKSKLAAERVIAKSGVPWTTLRATQFHDLILLAARGMARLPVIPIPSGFRFQPVDAGDVAARVVDLSLGAPAGRVPDLGGPRVYDMAALLREYLRVSGLRRALVPVRLPGQAARAFRAGANLAPDHATGHRTWEDFLGERVDVSSPR